MAQALCMLDNGYTHTHTHSEYVILNAIAQQHWLRERASMLPCAYIACLAGISKGTDPVSQTWSLHFLTREYGQSL
jgi:hypothetical protein